MAIRDILILPDKRLRLVSKPVDKVDTVTKKLVEDMFETMYDAPGIGLAAIQIGEATRVVTIDVSKEDEEERRQVFINPEIVAKSEDTNVHEEGCLSIPEYYEEVTRPAGVTVRYMDLDGKQQQLEATGLLATCLQHEIDHLDGKLFIDRLSPIKSARIKSKINYFMLREENLIRFKFLVWVGCQCNILDLLPHVLPGSASAVDCPVLFNKFTSQAPQRPAIVR